MPAIHPSFKIATQYGNHHSGFTEFTCKPHILETARITGKALAMTALDLLLKPEVMAATVDEWQAAEERRVWDVSLASE